ncbi:DUF7059 domain-containing protein [Nakamurella antarctica]|uniref:DUF7782 domain-containing protein n=1 Tax=Nakamurella antarctica TaxID=1902245 RepID=UPI001EEFF650|nr:methyltransferase [Nakamurella antarctica]
MNTHPLADLTIVDSIGSDLRAAGFDAENVPAFLGEQAHLALGRGDKVPSLRQTSDGSPLSTLIRLFLLGVTVPRAAAEAAFAATGIEAAVGAGAIELATHEAGADEVRAALDIRPYADEDNSYLVVSDLDSDMRPGPVDPDHVLGIGAASISLVRATVRQQVGSVLDMGTGCGVQALHAFQHAHTVTATDTSARALALAAATARLNGQEWELLAGSAFEPVAGRTFDQIVSNPPFVISAGEQRFSYRDSGIAGDGLVQQIVAGIPAHLNIGGTAQLLANWMVFEGTDWRERVGSWVKATGCDAWVVQRELADPAEYVAMWLKDAGEESGDAQSGESESVAGEWLKYFADNKVSGIGMGLITLRKSGSATPDVVLDELLLAGDEVTGDEAAAFLARRQWLRDTDDDALLGTTLSLSPAVYLEQRSLPSADGWTTVLRVIKRAGGVGATLQLDEYSQSLLAGCRGDAPLSMLIGLLAAAHGFDQKSLTELVLPAVRQAITRGIIHPIS